MLDLHGLPRPAPELPGRVFAHLAPLLSASSYYALRLTCRGWSAALTAAAPPRFRFSAAQRLPAELVQQIYGELQPGDFNAARRTCRGWMVAGLEGGVLEVMLRRGGWWGGMLADREVRRERRWGSAGEGGWEWEMGRRVGSECALGVGWTGCGFPDEECEEGVRSGMKLTCVTDFLELAGENAGEALHFTVSVCGRFLLVADGCVVYVYQLCEVERRGSTPHFPHGGSLEFYSKIVCPKRVLGVSMDTSSRRFAVAALLDDHTGMVVDLAASRLAVDEEGIPRQRRSIWGPEIRGMDALPSPEIGGENNAAWMPKTGGNADNVHVLSYPMYQHPQVNHVAYHVAPLPVSPSAFPFRYDPATSEPVISAATPSGHNLPSTPRTIYPALCTPTSPPLSVAICPQRRCVAFGCATGIELHWVDALTGQDRNRWFPLTAPSDFLYFLPQRKGVDSAKKLRLISSAGGVGQRGSLQHRFSGLRNDGTGQRGWNGDIGVGGLMRGEEGSRYSTSHYKATPLSDGETILYTDPATSLLSLGSATPPGIPTRLSRTFTFHGPASDTLPTVYAAGSELRWGVRVVVGYESSLWLFCVPPDRFAEEKERQKRSAGSNTNANTVDAGLDAPITIQGVKIATVEGLQDVAVDASGGSLTIWAFSTIGVAYTFQLDNGARRTLRERAVQYDGAVIDLVDSDGDVIMRDAPPLPSPPLFRTTNFDGASSVGGEGSARPSISISSEGGGERVVQSVIDVEVEMGEVDEGYWSGDEGTVGRGTFAIHVPRVEGLWSGESGEWEVDYMGVGVGMGGGWDLGGVGRLECDIL